jgi:hypothetical protein
VCELRLPARRGPLAGLAGLFMGHNGEGRILVIRRPLVPHAVGLVATEVAALKRMDGSYAPPAAGLGHRVPEPLARHGVCSRRAHGDGA